MKIREKTDREDDYLLFKNRLSIKMLLMMVGTILIIGVIYLFLLKDNFANFIVAILDQLIYHDRSDAIVAYLKSFKAYETGLF